MITQAQVQAGAGQISNEDLRKKLAKANQDIQKIVPQSDDPDVLNSASRLKLQMGYGGAKPSPEDIKEAAMYADKAVALARAQKNSEALILALRTRSYGKYWAGNYPAAAEDAKAILNVDRKDPVAQSILDAIGGREAPVRLLAGRMVPPLGSPVAASAPAPGQTPRTPQDWAARQERNPTPAGALIGRSMKLFKTGNMSDAMLVASQAVEADPRDPMAWSQRALIRYQAKDFPGAIADASRAVDLGWRWSPLLDIRAKALILGARQAPPSRRKSSYQSALADAEAAVAADARYASAYRTRAWAKLGLGFSAQDVLSDFENAARASDFERTFVQDFEFAKAALAQGRPAEVEARLAAQVQGVPGSGEAQAAARSTQSPGLGLGSNRLFAAAAGAAFLIIGLLSIALFRATGRPVTVIAPQGAPAPPALPGSGQGERESGSAGGEGGSGPPSRSGPLPLEARENVPAAAPPGVIGGRYRLGRLLGQGGMGMVFEGHDQNLDRKVAVKIPNDALDLQSIGRIEKEGRLVLGLGHHPNIVALYDIVREGGRIYLVFELVAGKTLTGVMDGRPHRRVPPATAARIISQAAAGLDHSHAKHVLHRDLKPSNIMIDPEGTAKVMDFGIAREIKDSLGAITGTVVGTPLYMAPEMEEGQALKESDLYALGLTAYEMLAGAPPFSGVGQLNQKRCGKFLPATEFVPTLPAGVDATLVRALHPEPARRFHSGAEFAQEIERAVSARQS